MRQSIIYIILVVICLASCKEKPLAVDIEAAKTIVSTIKTDTSLTQVLLSHKDVDTSAFAAFLSGYYKGNELQYISRFCDYQDSMVVSKYYLSNNKLIYSYNIAYKLTEIIPSLPEQKNYDTLSELEYYFVENKLVQIVDVNRHPHTNIQSQYLQDSKDCLKYSKLLMAKKKEEAANTSLLP